MIIESHAHLSFYRFNDTFPCLAVNENGKCIRSDSTREQMIAQMKEIGIDHVVEPAITCDSNRAVRALADRYPGYIHPAVGVHPRYVYDQIPTQNGRNGRIKYSDRKIVAHYASFGDVVAIGETGLDYHYRSEPRFKRAQKRWFKYQIRLADQLRLPLILHIRDADEDAIKLLTRYRKKLHGGVEHCFNGGAETAEKYLALGFHLGIGGALLHGEKASARLREAVRTAPLDRLIVETDAPYVLPDEAYFDGDVKRKKLRNSPLLLPLVIREIAAIKDLPAETVEQTVYENTAALFGISRSERKRS